MIEGYFDKSETPSYIRMADLLEDVYKNPPRQDPFAPPFRPHFNTLKFCALVGIHAMYAWRAAPGKAAPPFAGFADFAGRIYGYVDKAHISKQEVRAMEEKNTPLCVKNKAEAYTKGRAAFAGPLPFVLCLRRPWARRYKMGTSYPKVRFPFISIVSDTSSISLEKRSNSVNFSAGVNMLVLPPSHTPPRQVYTAGVNFREAAGRRTPPRPSSQR